MKICNNRAIIAVIAGNNDVIMTQKWVIIIRLTRNQASAQHAAFLNVNESA